MLVYPYSREGQELFPRPLVEVIVAGSASWTTLIALLDTGAEMVVFEEWVARFVGADLSRTASSGVAKGATGERFEYQFAELTLELKCADESWRWRANAAFTKKKLVNPILGFAGCLQYFDATFRGRDCQIELDWNGSYKPLL